MQTRRSETNGRRGAWWRRAAVALLACASAGLGPPAVDAQGLGVRGEPTAAARRSASDPAPSRILGRVLDAKTGEPLPGAEVAWEEGGARTFSGVDGLFVLRGVPAGDHVVRVSSLGYAPATVTAAVTTAGSWVEVPLEPAAVELEGLRVSALREQGSVVGALTEQRAANAMINVIGAQQIARSPDGDAAAAIRRLSGVSIQDGRYVSVRGLGERYTTATLNGARIPSPEPERRVVPLDLFPAGLLKSITTTKTFTPDQPGDFSGARVDIGTRSFPARRQVAVSASMGFHPDITGRSVLTAPSEDGDWLALGAAERRIPLEADRFLSATRGPEVNRVVGSFRNVWSPRRETARPAGSVTLSVGGQDEVLSRDVGYLFSGTYSSGYEVDLDQRRARSGAEGTEYNRYDGTSGRSTVLWGGLFQLGTAIGTHTDITLDNTYNRSAENEARREEGADEDTGARLRIDRLRYVERAVHSSRLAVGHRLGSRHRLSWSLSLSGVRRDEPDRSEFVTWLDPDVPTWFKHEEGAVRSFGSLEERSQEATVEYSWEVGDRDRPHRLSVGGSRLSTRRDAASQVFRLQPFDWSPADPRWQVEPESIFDGRYTSGDEGLVQLARDRSGGSYSARDVVSGAYVMGEVGLPGGVELVGGLRVEHSALTLDYESQLGAIGTVRPEYTDVLPSLALNIELSDQQKLRLSAARTLARPEYREVAPIAYREVLGGEQMIGNARLSRTLVDNYDLRWEWYPAYGEVLSVSLFAKRFRDPIEQRFLARSGTDTRTFENAHRATGYGVELELARNLGFVAPALAPLSMFANATLMRSEVDTGQDGDARRAMVGQAPYVVNGGLSYARVAGGASGTLHYNVVGPRIVNARASGSGVADVVEQARHSLDLSLRLPLSTRASGRLDMKNLLDSPYELRQGPVVREYHRAGRSMTLGLSWRTR